MTKPIYWDAEKNRKLIEERGISFEEIIFSLQNGGLLDDTEHPNTEFMLINACLSLVLTVMLISFLMWNLKPTFF